MDSENPPKGGKGFYSARAIWVRPSCSVALVPKKALAYELPQELQLLQTNPQCRHHRSRRLEGARIDLNPRGPHDVHQGLEFRCAFCAGHPAGRGDHGQDAARFQELEHVTDVLDVLLLENGGLAHIA